MVVDLTVCAPAVYACVALGVAVIHGFARQQAVTRPASFARTQITGRTLVVEATGAVPATSTSSTSGTAVAA